MGGTTHFLKCHGPVRKVHLISLRGNRTTIVYVSWYNIVLTYRTYVNIRLVNVSKIKIQQKTMQTESDWFTTMMEAHEDEMLWWALHGCDLTGENDHNGWHPKCLWDPSLTANTQWTILHDIFSSRISWFSHPGQEQDEDHESSRDASRIGDTMAHYLPFTTCRRHRYVISIYTERAAYIKSNLNALFRVKRTLSWEELGLG